ncbi:MAG: hypothetical protein JWP89_1948 [Schlesneria sp.]|nr:hypothetical protein [Schlesneria sp.]
MLPWVNLIHSPQTDGSMIVIVERHRHWLSDAANAVVGLL